MEPRLEIKKHKGNYEINTYYGKHQGSSYQNIVDKDAKKIANILMDLYREGFPIEEAVKIFLNKVTQRDWMGL